ncbi:MAG: hypothetical protein CND29_03360 [Marine Group II euryarchaeote MED-G36]|nr:MAG: hypothetical protein CND29_03360 [Marine Group II euryarchaeote MED-G36]
MMASALADPKLLLFIAGLIAATFVLSTSRSKPGVEGTVAVLNSSLLFATVGLASAVWTWIIHNQLVIGDASEFCTSEGIVQCGSVIGDPRYNNLFGVPWGVVGALAFTALLFLVLSIRMDVHAKWSETYTNYSWYAGLAGVPFLIYLIGVEAFAVHHICPFCTISHLSLLGFLGSVWLLRERRENKNWY